MMRLRGLRARFGCTVAVIHEDEGALPLDPRLDLRCHSPTGFEWGYGGSGPAQLALAMCAWCTGDDALALAVYQDFKTKVVCVLDHRGWELTQAELRSMIEDLLTPEILERAGDVALELVIDESPGEGVYLGAEGYDPPAGWLCCQACGLPIPPEEQRALVPGRAVCPRCWAAEGGCCDGEPRQ